ncbi:hypothetical protein [Acerihabitans sp.]
MGFIFPAAAGRRRKSSKPPSGQIAAQFLADINDVFKDLFAEYTL